MVRFIGLATVALCLAMASGETGRCDEKPKYTDRFNGGTDEADYVLEKITRNGREVTLTIAATLTKGPEKRQLLFFGVNMVDTDGNTHKARINANGARSRPEQVTLNNGVKTNITIRFPLDPKVTKVQLLEVTMSAVERVAIKFSDLEIPAK